MNESEASGLFSIRKASIDDLDLLMKIRMETLDEVFYLEYPEDQKMADQLPDENRKYFKKHLLDNSMVFLIGTVKNDPAAAGAILFHEEMPSPDNMNGTCGYLMNVFTRKPYRKSGFGRKIVQELIEEARNRNIDKIYLETSDPGRPLYLSMGFKDYPDMMILKGSDSE